MSADAVRNPTPCTLTDSGVRSAPVLRRFPAPTRQEQELKEQTREILSQAESPSIVESFIYSSFYREYRAKIPFKHVPKTAHKKRRICPQKSLLTKPAPQAQARCNSGANRSTVENGRFPSYAWRILRSLLLLLALAPAALAQSEGPEDLDHAVKVSDDVLWRLELGDIAEVRTFRYTGLPRTAGGNPMILYAYSFIPKNLDRGRKAPLIVLIHGGVHSNHMTGGPANAANIVRELMEQGYVVVAPDYRGSTGYGPAYAKAIDYGGKENDDILGARNWMLERYPFLDAARVGLVGWSHGGMIALFNIFLHPEAYACAYAGEPVSDLLERRKYLKSMPQTMAESAGEEAAKGDEEYRRRSPVTWAAKLSKPLLVHGNTSDETVHVVEIRHLVDALKASGQQFEHKIYEAAPGGHHFNRIDTQLARESRAEIYEFLRKYLQPAAELETTRP
jgi:dienelactone hydrolase